jgi:hypothetical protein
MVTVSVRYTSKVLVVVSLQSRDRPHELTVQRQVVPRCGTESTVERYEAYIMMELKQIKSN